MLQRNNALLQAIPETQLALRPLEDFSGSLAQKTYLSLGFRPGEVLRKSGIRAALGVSRSPVSEALARLAVEGLVEVVPQAGTFVARFSMAEIREGVFLREALELAANERVARTITTQAVRAMQVQTASP